MPQLPSWIAVILFRDALNIILAAESPPGAPAKSRWLGAALLVGGSQSPASCVTLSWQWSVRYFTSSVCIPCTPRALLLLNLYKTIPFSFCIDNVCIFFRLILCPQEKLGGRDD